MVRYGPRHVYLVRCWSLVTSSNRHSELVPHVEQPGVGLVDLVSEDGAGLGLDAAVEVAGDVVRHRAVLPAVPLQAGLGPLQRVGELEGAVGRGLTGGLNRERLVGSSETFGKYRQGLQLLLSLLVLHADGAADEDDDEDHHGGPNGGDRDGDDVVTFNRGQC